MVKSGKKKLAEASEANKRKSLANSISEENTKNGVNHSGDDDIEFTREPADIKENNSKNQRISAASTKAVTQEMSDSANSDNGPLSGSKSSTSSAPPRKKQRKAAKPKGGKAPAASLEKNQNKKTAAKSNEPEEVDSDNVDQVEEGEFEVEEIIGHKTTRGKSFFLVRWKGYGNDADSWEPEAELNCNNLIAEYRNKNESKKNVSDNEKPSTVAKAGRGKRKSNKKEDSDPSKEWQVERIVDYADDDEHGGLYRIRWKGFGAKDDTWEPESNLSCDHLLQKFKQNMENQRNVDTKELREFPKKTKRLVNETIPRSNLHNRIERSSKRAAAKNRVFYGEE